MRPSGGFVLAVLTAVNLVNYCDRGITPGAPDEFSQFIHETMNVPLGDTGQWLGVIFSSFIVCYSVACLIFGKLMQTVPKFRLLSIGLVVWVAAMFGAGTTYFMPRNRFAFWWFLCCRAVSGVGEAAFQCIVPPYVEDFAPPGKKSLWLGIFYTAIPCGTALGFGYGAMLAPAPPQSCGWGWAYLMESFVMLPCAIATAWLPPADQLLARRRLDSVSKPLLDPLGRPIFDGRGSPTPGCPGAEAIDAAVEASTHAIATAIPRYSDIVPPPRGDRYSDVVTEAATPNTRASITRRSDASSIRQSGTRYSDAADVAVAAEAEAVAIAEAANAEEVPLSLTVQLRWLVCCPPYVLLVLGYAAFTATVMGISTFCANFLQGLSLFQTEQEAAFAFGACAAAGGILGTPLGGVLTDLATRSSLRAAGVSEKSGGDRARHIEMRAITGTITIMITIGSIILLGAILVLYLGRYRLPFLLLLMLGIAATYATTSGISRVAMLLVPLRMRPFAIAVLTLNLHVFGDVPSPPIIGAVAGAWAPSCMGKPRPSCLGADPEDTSQPYTHDQYGVLAVLLFTTVYMFTSTLYWGACYAILAIRTRRLAADTTAPLIAAPPNASLRGSPVTADPSINTQQQQRLQ